MEDKQSVDRFQTYEDIPLFLDAKGIVQILGVSLTTAYTMLRDPGFPAVKIGRKRLVRKEKLFEWLQERETDVEAAQESYYAVNPFKKKTWSNFL